VFLMNHQSRVVIFVENLFLLLRVLIGVELVNMIAAEGVITKIPVAKPRLRRMKRIPMNPLLLDAKIIIRLFGLLNFLISILLDVKFVMKVIPQRSGPLDVINVITIAVNTASKIYMLILTTKNLLLKVLISMIRKMKNNSRKVVKKMMKMNSKTLQLPVITNILSPGKT